MAFEHRQNRGSMFRNDRKEREEQPDFTGDGKIMLPGMDKPVDVWISAWMNAPEGGKKGYFSLAFNEKKPKGDSSPVRPPSSDFDNDIPF